jgi:hypothetical protein
MKDPQRAFLQDLYQRNVYESNDLLKYLYIYLKYQSNALDVLDLYADVFLKPTDCQVYYFGESETEIHRKDLDVTERVLYLMQYLPESWYIIEKNMHILPPYFFSPSHTVWKSINLNEHAIHFLERNVKYIVWQEFMWNQNITWFLKGRVKDKSLLEKHQWRDADIPRNVAIIPDDMKATFWKGLLKNKHAQEYLELHPDSPFRGGKISPQLMGQDSCDPQNAMKFFRFNELFDMWRNFFVESPGNGRVLNLIVMDNFEHFSISVQNDIVKIASSSINPQAMMLLEMYPQYVDWHAASRNPLAVDIMECNVEKIFFPTLFSNPNPRAFEIFAKLPGITKDRLLHNLESFSIWSSFSANPCMISTLSINLPKVQGSFLSRNKNAIMILEHHTDKIYSWDVCIDRCRILLMRDSHAPPMGNLHQIHPDSLVVISLSWDDINWVWLKNHPEVVDKLVTRIAGNQKDAFFYLSSKPESYFIFDNYPHLIQWHGLSRNKAAIKLLLNKPDKIDWRHIYYNEKASVIMEHFPDNIVWKRLVGCHGTAHMMFPLNIQTARGRIHKDELMAYIYNPDRILATVNGNKDLFAWKLSHIERSCCLSDEYTFVSE